MACGGPLICPAATAPHTLGASEKSAAGSACGQEAFLSSAINENPSGASDQQVSSSTGTPNSEEAAKAANQLWQTLQRYDSWQCPPLPSQDNFLRTPSGALVDFSGLGSLDLPTIETPKAGQSAIFGLEPMASDVLLDAFSRELGLESQAASHKETESFTGSVMSESKKGNLDSSLQKDSTVNVVKAAGGTGASAELDSLDFPPIDFTAPLNNKNTHLVSHSSAAGLPSMPGDNAANSSALLPFDFPNECFILDSSDDSLNEVDESPHSAAKETVRAQKPPMPKRLTERQKARGAKGLPVGNIRYEDIEDENAYARDHRLSLKSKSKKIKKSKTSQKKISKPLHDKGVNSNRHVIGHGSLKGQKRGGCDYCGALKTPQWRKGPPKENGVPMHLCNACGVRLKKTGRLDM